MFRLAFCVLDLLVCVCGLFRFWFGLVVACLFLVSCCGFACWVLLAVVDCVR